MRSKWKVSCICIVCAFSLLCSCRLKNEQNENIPNEEIQWIDEQGVCYQKDEFEDVYCVVGLSETHTEEIIVPGTFQGVPVIKIKEFAFYQKSRLRNLIISNNILVIEKSAFSNCENLIDIELPETIEQIGYNAFDGCTQLKYEKKEGLYYLGNKKNNYIYLAKAEKNISLSSVEEGCKLIAPYAFMDCKDLEKVQIPFGVISIGRQGFDGCDKLKTVLLPRSIKFLDSFVFARCGKLSQLSFEGSSQEWELIEKIWDWRYECSVKNIVCSDKIVYIN